KVIIWDAEGGKQVKVIGPHEHVVTSLALSADEKLLVSGALDGWASVWDAESGTMRKPLPGLRSEPIAALAFVRDGAELAAAAGTRVRRWDLGIGKPPPVVPMPPAGGVVGSRAFPFRDAVIDAKNGQAFLITPSTASGMVRVTTAEPS